MEISIDLSKARNTRGLPVEEALPEKGPVAHQNDLRASKRIVAASGNLLWNHTSPPAGITTAALHS
jgi:hypothetical protein